jgi:hypothetical protein
MVNSGRVNHPTDEVIEALTLGTLTTAASLRVQRHIYRCPDCLKRLITTTLAVAIKDEYNPPHAIKPDLSKPVYFRHDTADGFIYSRVQRHGVKWVERHWGEQLDGLSEFETMWEANEQAVAAFAQMFPEHRCTERCCVDPPEPGRAK